MNKIIWKTSIVFLMLMVGVGYVFSETPKALTLQECIDIALQNNSSLRIAEYQVKSAGTGVTSARSSLLPQVGTSFSAGKYIQGARVVTTDVPTNEVDPITGRTKYVQKEIVQDKTELNSHSASISLSQNIFDFGRSINSLKEAKASKNAATHSMTNTRNQVIANVKEAYYNLLMQYKLREVYDEAVKVAEEQVNRVQTMMDIGLASQAEVYQAKVTLGSNKTQQINQINNIEIYKAVLNNALGLYPDSPLEIVEDLVETIYPEFDFQQAVEIAVEKNASLKAMELDVKANQYAINSAKCEYLPSIRGSASYSRSNNDYARVYTNELDKDYSISIGANMDLSIFRGFANKAAVQRNSINYNIAIENYAEAKRQLLSNVKQYYLQLAAYKDIIEINKQNIDAYQENLRLQQEKRRVGSGTELEVSQAQYELTQAKSNLIQAEFNAKIAKAQLEAALGIIEKN